MDYKKLIVIAIVIMIILVGLKKRSENRVAAPETTSITVEDVVNVLSKKADTNAVLTDEELALVQKKQEIILKEAESMKVKKGLEEERAKVLAEYDTKIANVESELESYRTHKLSFLVSTPTQ